jgi:hypothetical protein
MTEGQCEVESLSDALWMLRERQKMNAQSDNEVQGTES